MKRNWLKNQPVKPITSAGNILNSLERQIRGRICAICGQKTTLAGYRAHFDACKLTSDDSDLDVLDVLLPGEKSQRAAANPVVIDGSPLIVKKEPPPTQTQSALIEEEEVDENVYQKTPRKRNRVSDAEMCESQVTTRESISVRTTRSSTKRGRRITSTAERTSIHIEVNCNTEAEVKRVSLGAEAPDLPGTLPPTNSQVPTSPSDASRRVPSSQVATSSTQATELERGDQDQATNRGPDVDNSQPVSLSSTQSQTVQLSQTSVELLNGTEHTRERRSRRTIVKVEEIEKEALMTSKEVIGLASSLVSKELTESVFVNTSASQVADDPEVVTESYLHYTVSFALRIIIRVLDVPTTNGWKHDEKFWTQDFVILHKFVTLTPSARQMFMRLFLRKRHWLSLEALKAKYANVKNMEIVMQQLVSSTLVECGKGLTKLEDTLRLLPLAQLRVLAKKFQVDHTKGKMDLISTLRERTEKQKNLFGKQGTLATRMVKLAKELIGDVYRISDQSHRLFNAIFTLYSPTSMNSSLAIDQPQISLAQNMLFEMLQIETRKLFLPAPNPCEDIIDIYENKEELYCYLDAKDLEVEIVREQAAGNWEKAYELSAKGRELLDELLKECSDKWNSLPTSLRRFTSGWVLVRCVSHGAVCMERLKKYKEAVHIYNWLLTTPELKSMCVNERGAWWDRLILDVHSHLKAPDEALVMVNIAMEDEHIGDKDRLNLQDRALKITKGDFPVVVDVPDPVKKTISGSVLGKDLGDGRVNRFIIENEGGLVDASVEEVARLHYIKKEGFTNGVHVEGAIWHTVMGFLFYDVINHFSIKRMWLSELQQGPLDLNYSEFYPSRKAAFDERLRWLRRASEEKLIKRLTTNYEEHRMETAADLQWSAEPEEIQCFVRCCGGNLIADVTERVIKDYRNTRSGFPDLTLWNEKKKQIAVVEVKGPNDRLSTKQRLWLHFFAQRNIRSEVCHVTAVRPMGGVYSYEVEF